MLSRLSLPNFKQQLILIILLSTLLPALTLASILLFQIKQNAEGDALNAVNIQLMKDSDAIIHGVTVLDSRLQQFALDQNNVLAAESSVFSVYARESMFALLKAHPEINLLQIYDIQLWPTESAPTEFEFFGLDPLLEEQSILVPPDADIAYQLFEDMWLFDQISEKSQVELPTPLFFSISLPLRKYNDTDPSAPIRTGFLIVILSLDRLLESSQDYRYTLSATPIEPVPLSAGKDVTVLVKEIDLYGQTLYLALQLETSLLSEPTWRAVQTIFSLALVIIILSSVAAFYFSQRLSRPFNKIELAIRGFQEGNYRQATPDLRYSEFNRLYKVLAEMGQIIEQDQQLLEARLNEKQAIFNTMLDSLIVIDEHGTIENINRTTESLFGYEREELLGQNVKSLMGDGDAKNHDGRLARYMKTGHSHMIGSGVEVVARKKSGDVFYAYLSVAEYKENDRTQFVGTIRDISHQVKKRQDLEFDALHDELTQLPTRRLLDQRIDEAIQESIAKDKHFYVLFLDLNNFKPINDTYGHAVGDEVLKVIASRLKQSVRSADVCARVGGDEFVILCEPSLEAIAIEKIVKKLKVSVSEPMRINEQTLSVGTSTGYARFPGDGECRDALLRVADQRMYAEKNLGKSDADEE